MTDRHAPGAGPAAALVALSGIWGYNWVVMKVALADAPPLSFAAWRAVLGAGALFAVLALTRRALAPARGASLILLGVLQTAGFVALVALALETGAVGKSAVLAYTMPFWTVILATLLLGERMNALQWLAVGLAGAGLAGILSPWQHALAVEGSLWSLGAAWCWAGSIIVVKRMRLEGGELLNVAAWQMGIGSVVLVGLALALDTEPIRWTPSFSLALAYNAVPATALAWLLWLYALSRLPAAVTGLATLATPVISALAAWLQLGESPTAFEAGGMALIVAALALLSVAGWRRARTAPG